MPDISMCKDEKCPLRKHCYRYMATPNKYGQSYANYGYDKSKGGCIHYWRLEDDRKS